MTATVIIPCVATMLRKEVVAAVRAQFRNAEIVVQDEDKPLEYARDLRLWWRRPGDLVVVEQDVVIPPRSLRRLLACPHPWCGHLLPYAGQLLPAALGYVRFNGSLKLLYPELMESALGDPAEPSRPCLWYHADGRIARWMRMHKIEWHRHDPAVSHLHDWEANPPERYRERWEA